MRDDLQPCKLDANDNFAIIIIMVINIININAINHVTFLSTTILATTL